MKWTREEDYDNDDNDYAGKHVMQQVKKLFSNSCS